MKSCKKVARPYEVGFAKPPKDKQFRKGSSGNLRGKKRGQGNLIAAFKRVVQRKVTMKIGGESRIVTIAEAVIIKNYHAALQKDQGAMANILRLAEQAGELVDQTDKKQVGGFIAVPERVSIDEFLAQLGRTRETE